MSVAASTIDVLVAELVELLGADAVQTDQVARQRASADGSWLSPVIQSKLPLGLADVVAFPRSAAQIGEVVAAAVRHRVPITPRGKGTGNYGQGIPMSDGLVIDTSRARAIVEIGDGWVTAEAGAVLSAVEGAAQDTGQELLMYPSTAQSSLGGFLAGGSGGTGSIEHGVIVGGPFVIALDVVYATGEPELVHVVGEEAQAFLHNFGTAGIIARATVRLEPLRPWRAFYASFEAFPAALSVIRDLCDMQPAPRLASADLPRLAEALPTNPGIPAGRASLRAILSEDTVETVTAWVEAAGGRVELVLSEAKETMRLSRISYNHPIMWLQRAYPNQYFHVEAGGWGLIDRLDEVQSVYPDGMLHIEAQKNVPIGMLAGRYESEEAVLAGMERLHAIGVRTHNPHQWYVDVAVERTREIRRRTDPHELLNPGKLPASDPGTNSIMART
jgi:FAD/FMN-containing dehydrogenase